MVSAKGTSESSEIDVTQQIRMIRGQRMLLDSDLAALYGVSTKRLNEQVRPDGVH